MIYPRTLKSTFIGGAFLFCFLINAHGSTIDSLPLDIPVTNAGFENGLDSWGLWNTSAGQATINNKEVHSGKNSLELKALNKTNNPLASQSIENIQGNATYHLSTWTRLAPGSPPVEAAVKIESYNSEGKNTRQVYGRIRVENDQWQQLGVILPVPDDTVRCSILVRVYGNGAALFDDVKFETSEISIIDPVRSAATLDGAARIKYEIKLYHPWLKKTLPTIKAELTLTNPSLSQQITAEVKPGQDNQHFYASIPVKLSQTGDYQLRLLLQRDNKWYGTQFPAMIFTTVQKRQPEYLSDAGVFLRQGKPFFPIGMYHVAHTDAGYELLAKNGFNAIQGLVINDLEKTKESLARAQKYGLAIDMPLYGGGQVGKNLQNSLEKIRQFADNPAVISWKIVDEPEFRPAIADEIPAVYRALKAADSKHPFELTLARDSSLPLWSQFCDIIQVDRYPVPTAPLTNVASISQNVMKVKQPWQNFSFVLQSGWIADLSNQPTVAQARSMVYLALINGAKGIWWYSMYDPGWDLTKTPFWPHMKDINAEIKVLSEPIMLGKEVKSISNDNAKVLFTARKYEGKIYLLITNPENTPAQVTLRLPQNMDLKTGQTLDETTNVSIQNQEIKLSLTAIDSLTLVLQ